MSLSREDDSNSSNDDLSVYAAQDLNSSPQATSSSSGARGNGGRSHERSPSIQSTRSAKTQHRRTSSTGAATAPVTGNRSRARAFSFLRDRNSSIPLNSLPSDRHTFSASRSPSISYGRSRAGSVSYPPQSQFGESQMQFSENPFETDDYENALASPRSGHSSSESFDSEQSEDDNDIASSATRRAERTIERERRRASKLERRGYRESFQPLLTSELSWMGVSAAAVLALTVLAIVISFGGKAVVVGVAPVDISSGAEVVTSSGRM